MLSALTEADRAAARRLLGIEAPAAWCWTDDALRAALEHGIELTDAGCRIMRPRHADLRGDRVVFSGGFYGEHSLSIDNSDADRVLAHWSGYVEAS